MRAESASSPRVNTPSGSVLRRLLIKPAARAAIEDPPLVATDPGGPDIAVEKLAATCLGRVAEKLLHLPVFAQQVQLRTVSAAELPEVFPEWSLFALVEGRSDSLGVMALCPQFLTSIIEMQATGRVSSREAAVRRPTRTDATIAAEFVNGFLGELGRHLSHPQQVPEFGSFRYATYLDDPRPLGLMLDDTPFSLLSLQFRSGAGGQRDCTLHLALPAPPQTQAGVALQRTHMEERDPPPPIPAPSPPKEAETLAAAVQEAPVDLVGILARRKLSLQVLRALTVGSLIPLPGNALEQIRLVTPRGQFLAQGRLGEAEGQYALRLRAASGQETATEPQSGDSLAFAPEPPMEDLAMADAFRDLPDPPGSLVELGIATPID